MDKKRSIAYKELQMLPLSFYMLWKFLLPDFEVTVSSLEVELLHPASSLLSLTLT
jgi:hypothetical protein